MEKVVEQLKRNDEPMKKSKEFWRKKNEKIAGPVKLITPCTGVSLLLGLSFTGRRYITDLLLAINESVNQSISQSENQLKY